MHRLMIATISRLNQNKFFKFISSIKLAVPVMIALIISVAIGTIIESLHNTEYARIALYDTSWFSALLGLLALNVFASMMSRYPWKQHQIGFVLTHVGIIILMTGSLITKRSGLDGTLQIPEGQSQGQVVLSKLMVAYQFEGSNTISSAVFEKSLSDKSGSELDFINDKIGHVVKVEKFVPFAEIDKGYTNSQNLTGPVGISFGLKSQFFDVKEWLHSVDNPMMQLGPATLKLIIDDETASAESKKTSETQIAKEARLPASQADEIQIVDAKSNKVIKSVSVASLKKDLTLSNGVKIHVKQSFDHAQVANNKIVESEDPSSSPNPALELEVSQGSKNIREVLYAKFPNFSLNKDGVFGFRFHYVSAGTTEASAPSQEASRLPPGHPAVDQTADAKTEETPPSPGAGMAGNLVEFHVKRSQPDQVTVQLWKNKQKVAEQVMKEGDIFQTPWMGMQIFVGTISFNSVAAVQVRSIRPQPGKNLPPSAVFVRPAGAQDGFWLTQGDVKNVSIAGRNVSIAFTNETVQLPFELFLKKFSKKDYPGTETPYSYESLVVHNQTKKEQLISMNEPLKSNGYTLYQASFIMAPGQNPISVLSVNRDPGRAIKYLGSLILSLGIATFTLMRSRLFKKVTPEKNKL